MHVGNVQVISESNPNPLAAIRKTLYVNQQIHNPLPHCKGHAFLAIVLKQPRTPLEKGQRKAVEIITMGKGLLNLYKFLSAKMNVGEGADLSL